MRAGDSITATVTASSTTSGTATLVNHSTGQTVSHSFTGQPALCQEVRLSYKTYNGSHPNHVLLQNAEWIVEDFEEVCPISHLHHSDSSDRTSGQLARSPVELRHGNLHRR